MARAARLLNVLRSRPADPAAAGPTVTLVTRHGCHLCEVAAPVVRAEARRAGARYLERDVDATAADRQAYTDKVPVVLLDGVEHAYGIVDAAALRWALRQR